MDATQQLLSCFSIEIVPGDERSVTIATQALPTRTETLITSLPRSTFDAVAGTARGLRRGGLVPVPHIAARNFRSEGELDQMLLRLAAEAGVDRVLLIGGDREIPDFGNPKEGKPLRTARQKAVLKLAAEKAGWGKPLPKGTARGIASYFSFESYTACVAEVSIKDRAVKVNRLVYAVDCGRAINPNGVRAQVESASDQQTGFGGLRGIESVLGAVVATATIGGVRTQARIAQLIAPERPMDEVAQGWLFRPLPG